VFSAFVNCVLSVVNKCIPLLCLGILLAGCAGERPASMAKRDGILLLGNGPEPTALDPHVTTGTAELNIQMALFEGLLSPDPETLEPLPGVAHEWRVSEDGLTYRFLLREDAVWSDGNPVRAEDFAAAWERALNPAQGAPYATMLHVLEGAEAYNKGQTKDFSSVGVRIVDSNTLEVRLHQFVPYFLNALIHPVWYPIPSHRLNPAKVDRVGDWTTADAFIGNGPFVLKEWLPNQYVEVIRN
jgi:oligopeptide transport system substrate-binding protein